MKVLVALLLVFTSSIHADELQSKLDKIIRKYGIDKSQLGIAVFDLGHTAQQPLFALNEEKDMVPASTTKLATAFTALQKLGGSHKFVTGLWSSGKVENGVLKGDLVLKGGGDTCFVSESMWFLVNEFVRTGITKIEGNVLVDDTDFDAVRTDPTRDPERVDRAYDAPVSAMSFNWNSINVFVRPTKDGQPPQVILDPIDNGFKIRNIAKTVAARGHKVEVQREGSRIVVRGTMSEDEPEYVAYKNIDDPIEWSGRNLVFFLSQRGITVSGKVKAGKKSDSAKLLAKADSKPLNWHIADMMKFSNNYVAEMLTKNIALDSGNQPATLEQGMRVIRATLEQKAGLAQSRFVLYNPSGFSHKNHFKPIDMARLLVRAHDDFPTFPELLSALPIAGVDGTLKNRMKDSPASGWVRAKTGLLAGVVGLAGYAGRKDGSARAFAFMFNGKSDQGEQARRLFDALATELVQ